VTDKMKSRLTSIFTALMFFGAAYVAANEVSTHDVTHPNIYILAGSVSVMLFVMLLIDPKHAKYALLTLASVLPFLRKKDDDEEHHTS